VPPLNNFYFLASFVKTITPPEQYLARFLSTGVTRALLFEPTFSDFASTEVTGYIFAQLQVNCPQVGERYPFFFIGRVLGGECLITFDVPIDYPNGPITIWARWRADRRPIAGDIYIAV